MSYYRDLEVINGQDISDNNEYVEIQYVMDTLSEIEADVDEILKKLTTYDVLSVKSMLETLSSRL